ncbi:Phage lysin [Devosia sp. DBB001]|nr:Phage lysin [Devosia sp. DBB001]
MAVNNATLALIREYEGFVDHWYPDPAHGWKVPTCCIGHTDAAGEPKYAATKGKKFTEAEGRAILASDLAAVEAQVRKAVAVPLNENQFGALVSFTFNLGARNLGGSTLLKKLNKGDYTGAADEFGKWVNAGGQRLDGLVRRRTAERALFLTPATLIAAQKPTSTRNEPAIPKAAVLIIILAIIAAFGAAFFFFAH